ncbi:hypothetical protein D3C83_42750 [compost metagenome]
MSSLSFRPRAERMAPMALSRVWLYVACEVDWMAMLTDRFVLPKSPAKRVMGMITRSSWLWPKDEPFSASTPMIWNGFSLTLMVLPMGVSLAKSFFWMLGPTTVTLRARSTSSAEMFRPW